MRIMAQRDSLEVMKHLRWIVPLVVMAVSPLVGINLSYSASEQVQADDDPGLSGQVVLSLVLIFPVPVLAFIFVIIGAVKVYGSWARVQLRRARRQSKQVVAQGGPPSEPEDFYGGMERAAQLYSMMQAGGWEVPAQNNFVVTLEPGEYIVFELKAHYSRYYGQDVSVSGGGGFAFGPPMFVVGALAVNTLMDRGVKKKAQAMAAGRWREEQFSLVIVTDRRLLIHAGGRWLWFYYSGTTAIYPDLEHSTLAVDFGDTEPLRLAGPDVPSVAVWMIHQRSGYSVAAAHPQLQVLKR